MDADCDGGNVPATSKTTQTEVGAGKEEEGNFFPTAPATCHRRAWADAREMHEKSRGCQKFSKRLREAGIYRSFRAGTGSFRDMRNSG